MDRINQMIEDCIENESLLTEPEINFIDAMDCKDMMPSIKQQEILKRIWRKVVPANDMD